MQGQRSLDVLYIILREGEDWPGYHVAGCRTPSEIRDLEPLVDGAARLHSDRATAGDKAPGVQCAAILHGDRARICKLDLSIVTCHVSGGRSGHRLITSANTNCAVDGKAGVVCKCQFSEAALYCRNVPSRNT